jgi:hypothetical protein
MPERQPSGYPLTNAPAINIKISRTFISPALILLDGVRGGYGTEL